MKSEGDLQAGLGGNIVTDEDLEPFVGHFPFFVLGIELFFLEIEAVFAVEVTDWPNRLGHDMKAVAGRLGGFG